MSRLNVMEYATLIWLQIGFNCTNVWKKRCNRRVGNHLLVKFGDFFEGPIYIPVHSLIKSSWTQVSSTTNYADFVLSLIFPVNYFIVARFFLKSYKFFVSIDFSWEIWTFKENIWLGVEQLCILLYFMHIWNIHRWLYNLFFSSLILTCVLFHLILPTNQSVLKIRLELEIEFVETKPH